MVYNWDGKEADCYRLYVEERRTLEEVLDYWEQRGFTPSKRAFQTQFKRWDFPSKQNPAHRNSALVARVKQLWEGNVTQKDMLSILQSEGFGISDRELLRLRLRFQWLLREGRPKEAGEKGTKNESRSTRVSDTDRWLNGPDASAETQEQHQGIRQQEREERHEEDPTDGADVTVSLDPEEALRRQVRQEQLRIESEEKWRTRKRRRRTRPFAGLPADAPGAPPRFPSETTLDESKAYLGLDNNQYREIRQQFQAICEEEGVMKKRVAGPEKWSQLKQRLVRENAHLSHTFKQDAEAAEHIGAMTTATNPKALSLDVICTDVTKRLRAMGTRVGIPEAKNALGLNPEEARRVRDALHTQLKAVQFPSKIEAGEQHWRELKDTWIESSDPLMQALAPGEADPKHADKLKAIDVIAQDVIKRYRAEQNNKHPESRKKEANTWPGPSSAPPTATKHASRSNRKGTRRHAVITANSSDSTSTPSNMPDFAAMDTASDFQIDPSLLLAASDPSMLLDSTAHLHNHLHYSPHQQQSSHHLQPPSPAPLSLPVPIYFRLHPNSQTRLPHKTIWLGILQSGTMTEIQGLAMREHPGTAVVRLEGLVVHKTPGQPDHEVQAAIDDEQELTAYLHHVNGSGKATFVVLLGYT